MRAASYQATSGGGLLQQRSLATRTRKMPAVAAGRRAGRPGQKVPSCIAHVLSYAVRFSGAACCIAHVLSDAVRRSGANSKRSQLFEFVLLITDRSDLRAVAKFICWQAAVAKFICWQAAVAKLICWQASRSRRF